MVLEIRAADRVAVLENPVVFASRADNPVAVLSNPVVLEESAASPTPTFPKAIIVRFPAFTPAKKFSKPKLWMNRSAPDMIIPSSIFSFTFGSEHGIPILTLSVRLYMLPAPIQSSSR